MPLRRAGVVGSSSRPEDVFAWRHPERLPLYLPEHVAVNDELLV